jgi:hypothetical protein
MRTVTNQFYRLGVVAAFVMFLCLSASGQTGKDKAAPGDGTPKATQVEQTEVSNALPEAANKSTVPSLKPPDPPNCPVPTSDTSAAAASGGAASFPAGAPVLASLSYGSAQTMVTLAITGSGFSKFSDLVFCYVVSTGVYLQNLPAPFLGFNGNGAPFADKTINGTISIMPNALKGQYEIFLSDGTKLTDTKLAFTVRGANNGQYADCTTQGGLVSGNESLFCSQALLDYQQTQRVFGKGVADQYIAVEVTVRNLSDDYEYILHDIRLGTTDAVVASIDSKLVRGVAENTEQFSARAIAVRLTESSATAFTGIAAFLGNSLLTSVAALVAGPGQLGLKHAIPDLSIAELNRVNDLAFSTGGIVIPKHAAVPMVAFLSSKIFVPGCPDEAKTKPHSQNTALNNTRGDQTTGTSDTTASQDTVCYGKTVNIAFRELKTRDLMTFQKGLIVEVSGAHVQELAGVTVTQATGSPLALPLDLTKLAKSAKETITLNGTGLDSVTRINLIGSGNTALPYQPVATAPADSTKLQFVIDGASPPAAGTYSITVDTSTQKGVKTSVSLTLVASVSPAALTYDNEDVGTKSAAKTVTVTNTSDATMTNLLAKLSGANSDDFAVVPGATKPCATTLSASTECTLDVTFTPTANASSSRTASLDVTYGTAPATTKVSVALSGSATFPAGQATFSPGSTVSAVDSVKVGSNAGSPVVLTIWNLQASPITTISVKAVASTYAGDFSGVMNKCSGELANGQNCTITWTFKPKAGPTGTRSAQYTVSYKVGNKAASPATMSLSGTATN